jgi:hypothetical protein
MEEAERDPGLGCAADFRFRSKREKCERNASLRTDSFFQAKPAPPRVRPSFFFRSKRGNVSETRFAKNRQLFSSKTGAP